MKTEQRSFSKSNGWSNEKINDEAQLVLAFAAPSLVKEEKTYLDLKGFYPNSDVILVSTSWEILDIEVNDDTISVSALYFEKTPIKVATEEVPNMEDSFSVWVKLANNINSDDLSYSMVFSDGLWVNWAKLAEWISSVLSDKVWVTWGLSWDWADFNNTYVSLNGVPSEKNNVVIVGLYWDSIKVGNSSVWWWDSFWMERVITKSIGNVVYEIDGEPVLDLYKNYLWDKAEWLPGSGLLFPISIYKEESKNSLVRTLLAVDENKKTITFAWDVPEGHKAFLMKANFRNLIGWSEKAWELSYEKNDKPEFALLVSCIWRKLVLKQRVEEEVEVIRDIVWDECSIAGFYSYWEIWVNKWNWKCSLHNQTMTVALFSEK